MANVNLTPKQRFQESKDNVSKHREMIESREFERAIDYALMEYQLQSARQTATINPPNANDAVCRHYSQVGACEFVAILRNLAEPPPVITARAIEQLDHKA